MTGCGPVLRARRLQRGGKGQAGTATSQTAYPILFLTSVHSIGFNHQLNTFGNHGNGVVDAVADGDLSVRYPMAACATSPRRPAEAWTAAASRAVPRPPPCVLASTSRPSTA